MARGPYLLLRSSVGSGGRTTRRPADDPFLELLQAKGLAHEQAYLKSLQAAGKQVVDLAAVGSTGQRMVKTREATAAGALFARTARPSDNSDS